MKPLVFTFTLKTRASEWGKNINLKDNWSHTFSVSSSQLKCYACLLSIFISQGVTTVVEVHILLLGLFYQMEHHHS